MGTPQESGSYLHEREPRFPANDRCQLESYVNPVMEDDTQVLLASSERHLYYLPPETPTRACIFPELLSYLQNHRCALLFQRLSSEVILGRKYA